jgi:DNA invertase Pin-like site-specific DNA recombinase
MSRNRIAAVAYLRTSSATNVGSDKDSDKRQRAAIAGFAKANGYEIVDEFYDAGVSGANAVTERPGFIAMLDRIAGNGVSVILVESPDRFARDLAVQLAGHEYLERLGVSLIPASAPDFFLEDTPTAVLVRQVLGAIAQFEKASLVAKLKAARERKRKATGRCEGNKPLAETRPEVVALVHELSKTMSYRRISAELAARGHLTRGGKPFAASQIQRMLASLTPFKVRYPNPEQPRILQAEVQRPKPVSKTLRVKVQRPSSAGEAPKWIDPTLPPDQYVAAMARRRKNP